MCWAERGRAWAETPYTSPQRSTYPMSVSDCISVKEAESVPATGGTRVYGPGLFRAAAKLKICDTFQREREGRGKGKGRRRKTQGSQGERENPSQLGAVATLLPSVRTSERSYGGCGAALSRKEGHARPGHPPPGAAAIALPPPPQPRGSSLFPSQLPYFRQILRRFNPPSSRNQASSLPGSGSVSCFRDSFTSPSTRPRLEPRFGGGGIFFFPSKFLLFRIHSLHGLPDVNFVKHKQNCPPHPPRNYQLFEPSKNLCFDIDNPWILLAFQNSNPVSACILLSLRVIISLPSHIQYAVRLYGQDRVVSVLVFYTWQIKLVSLSIYILSYILVVYNMATQVRYITVRYVQLTKRTTNYVFLPLPFFLCILQQVQSPSSRNLASSLPGVGLGSVSCFRKSPSTPPKPNQRPIGEKFRFFSIKFLLFCTHLLHS